VWWLLRRFSRVPLELEGSESLPEGLEVDDHAG